MISLNELTLSDLLPSSITSCPELVAAAEAASIELTQITEHIYDVSIFSRIDELPEDIVDMLAWQFHVDFYEPLGLGIEQKRSLVKRSLDWHRRKGTKSVLIEILQALFLEDFEIQEWFEYGGEPYYFKIITRDFVNSPDAFGRMLSAINEVKNVRSWLEEIRVITKVFSSHYCAGSVTLVPRFVFSDRIRFCSENYAAGSVAFVPRVSFAGNFAGSSAESLIFM